MSQSHLPAKEHAPGLWLRDLSLPLRWQDFKLIAFDMDSTLINIECIDEVADAAGRKAEGDEGAADDRRPEFRSAQVLSPSCRERHTQFMRKMKMAYETRRSNDALWAASCQLDNK